MVEKLQRNEHRLLLYKQLKILSFKDNECLFVEIFVKTPPHSSS